MEQMLGNTEPRDSAASQEGRAGPRAPHSSPHEANIELESIQRLGKSCPLPKPAGLVIFSKMMLAPGATNLRKWIWTQICRYCLKWVLTEAPSQLWVFSGNLKELQILPECCQSAIFHRWLEITWKRRSKERGRREGEGRGETEEEKKEKRRKEGGREGGKKGRKERKAPEMFYRPRMPNIKWKQKPLYQTPIASFWSLVRLVPKEAEGCCCFTVVSPA